VVPVAGQVADALLGEAGVRAGLVTVRAFVEAAGDADGPAPGGVVTGCR